MEDLTLSVQVLLNLIKEMGERDKIPGLSSILPLFRNELNKFNNTEARILDSDSVFYMTLKQFCLQFVIVVFPDHTHLLFRNGVFWGVKRLLCCHIFAMLLQPCQNL